MKFLSVNIGHITNSSSVVYSFPKEILDNEEIQFILEAYEIPDNMIGEELWNTYLCHSFVSTEEGWSLLNRRLGDNRTGNGHGVDIGKKGDVVFVYGDNYLERKPWLLLILDVFQRVAKKQNIRVKRDKFN